MFVVYRHDDNLWHCLARPASILLHKKHSSFGIQHVFSMLKWRFTCTTSSLTLTLPVNIFVLSTLLCT